jgi:hypothetical protein
MVCGMRQAPQDWGRGEAAETLQTLNRCLESLIGLKNAADVAY